MLNQQHSPQNGNNLNVKNLEHKKSGSHVIDIKRSETSVVNVAFNALIQSERDAHAKKKTTKNINEFKRAMESFRGFLEKSQVQTITLVFQEFQQEKVLWNS